MGKPEVAIKPPTPPSPIEQAMAALESHLPLTDISKSESGLTGEAVMKGRKVGILLDQSTDIIWRKPSLHLSVDSIDPNGRSRRILNKNDPIDTIDDIPGWVSSALQTAISRL